MNPQQCVNDHKSAQKNKFFFDARTFLQKFSIKGVLMNLQIKFAVDLAKRFPTKSISWPIVFIETTRQRWSKKISDSLDFDGSF